MGLSVKVRADAKGRYAEGQRNVAVGGAAADGDLFADGLFDKRKHLVFKRLHFSFVNVAAGSVAHGRDPHRRPLTGTGEDILKPSLHKGKAVPVVGAVFAKHFCRLGDGIYRGAALNNSHVVRGLCALLFGNLDLIYLANDLAQHRNGVFSSEAVKGMSALGQSGDLISVGAYGAVDDDVKLTVEGDEGRYPVSKAVEQSAGALKVAKPLLAGIKEEYNTVFGDYILFSEELCRQKQNDHACGIVGNTGAEELALLLAVGHRRTVGEDGVGVGGKNGDLIASLTVYGEDYVQRLVDIDPRCACVLKPFFAVFCPLSLKMRGGGDKAQLSQGLIQKLAVF